MEVIKISTLKLSQQKISKYTSIFRLTSSININFLVLSDIWKDCSILFITAYKVKLNENNKMSVFVLWGNIYSKLFFKRLIFNK